jgi:hypothetical protein
MNIALQVVRKLHKTSRAFDLGPLNNAHHQALVRRCYRENPSLPLPKAITIHGSWDQLKSDPQLTSETLIFVDGGITEHPINVGKAVIVNDGGIIRHRIICGFLFRDGGITEVPPVKSIKQLRE